MRIEGIDEIKKRLAPLVQMRDQRMADLEALHQKIAEIEKRGRELSAEVNALMTRAVDAAVDGGDAKQIKRAEESAEKKRADLRRHQTFTAEIAGRLRNLQIPAAESALSEAQSRLDEAAAIEIASLRKDYAERLTRQLEEVVAVHKAWTDAIRPLLRGLGVRGGPGILSRPAVRDAQDLSGKVLEVFK